MDVDGTCRVGDLGATDLLGLAGVEQGAIPE